MVFDILTKSLDSVKGKVEETVGTPFLSATQQMIKGMFGSTTVDLISQVDEYVRVMLLDSLYSEFYAQVKKGVTSTSSELGEIISSVQQLQAFVSGLDQTEDYANETTQQLTKLREHIGNSIRIVGFEHGRTTGKKLRLSKVARQQLLLIIEEFEVTMSSYAVLIEEDIVSYLCEVTLMDDHTMDELPVDSFDREQEKNLHIEHEYAILKQEKVLLGKAVIDPDDIETRKQIMLQLVKEKVGLRKHYQHMEKLPETLEKYIEKITLAMHKRLHKAFNQTISLKKGYARVSKQLATRTEKNVKEAIKQTHYIHDCVTDEKKLFTPTLLTYLGSHAHLLMQEEQDHKQQYAMMSMPYFLLLKDIRHTEDWILSFSYQIKELQEFLKIVQVTLGQYNLFERRHISYLKEIRGKLTDLELAGTTGLSRHIQQIDELIELRDTRKKTFKKTIVQIEKLQHYAVGILKETEQFHKWIHAAQSYIHKQREHALLHVRTGDVETLISHTKQHLHLYEESRIIVEGYEKRWSFTSQEAQKTASVKASQKNKKLYKTLQDQHHHIELLQARMEESYVHDSQLLEQYSTMNQGYMTTLKTIKKERTQLERASQKLSLLIKKHKVVTDEFTPSYERFE